MTEKALLIKGPLPDLGDLLRIASAEGKKVLNVESVNVKPYVFQRGNDYIVFVESNGCCKVSDVGNKSKRMD